MCASLDALPRISGRCGSRGTLLACGLSSTQEDFEGCILHRLLAWRLGADLVFKRLSRHLQVASHAQKHFLRTNGVCKRKSRFSLLEQAVSALPDATVARLGPARACACLPSSDGVVWAVQPFCMAALAAQNVTILVSGGKDEADGPGLAQASAQGLLASESQCLPSAPLAIPIFYGMPAFSAGQADRREGHSSSATSSDNSGAGALQPCCFCLPIMHMHHSWPFSCVGKCCCSVSALFSSLDHY